MNCYVDYLEYLSETLVEDEQPPLVPARPELLLSLPNLLKKELSIGAPEPYLEFLRRANGFQYNGVFFFSCDPAIELPDLVAENLYLRHQNSLFEDYLVLGQSNLWHYAYHEPSSTYRALQVDAARNAYYEFEDFDDCLSSALEETLELLEDEVN